MRPSLCLQEVLHSQLLYILSVLSGWTYIGVGRDDGLKAGEYSPIIYRPSLGARDIKDSLAIYDP
jgi:hypothetical protein